MGLTALSTRRSRSLESTVMMMVRTIGFLPWRVEPMTALAGPHTFGWGRSSGSSGRGGADKTLQTLASLDHRGLDPPIVGGLPALVQDCPDDVGHKVCRDPPVQLGGQGPRHHGRQLPAVVRRGA